MVGGTGGVAIGSRRTLRLLALALLSFVAACRTALPARKDAGRSTDARSEDAVADRAEGDRALPDLPLGDAALPDLPLGDAATPDLPANDVGSPDLTPGSGAPKAFRFDNHTARTAYVQVEDAVGCRMQSASGWQACSYFALGCLFRCADVQVGQNCCVLCEQLLALYAIAPGESRSLPWNGNLYAKATGSCAECECQQATTVPSGDFEASARVFADYQCTPSGCQTSLDGTITSALPQGGYAALAVPFRVPYAGEEVVLDITWLPTADAGAPLDAVAADAPPASDAIPDVRASPDLAPADVASASDPRSEPLPSPFADLPGHTFQIADSDTALDASFGGRACGGSNPGAVYNLIFSADGADVQLVRMDGPQEVILNGTLRTQSAEILGYYLTNAFAGGELSIRREGDTFIALLVLYGSGVPVMWCIASPMRPV
jgi:hypothetical protein